MTLVLTICGEKNGEFSVARQNEKVQGSKDKVSMQADLWIQEYLGRKE